MKHSGAKNRRNKMPHNVLRCNDVQTYFGKITEVYESYCMVDSVIYLSFQIIPKVDISSIVSTLYYPVQCTTLYCPLLPCPCTNLYYPILPPVIDEQLEPVSQGWRLCFPFNRKERRG